MSDTQQIEIIGSDMIEFPKISANAEKCDGGWIQLLFFFFSMYIYKRHFCNRLSFSWP